MGRKTHCGWFLALGLLGSLTAGAGSPVWAIHGDHNTTVYLAGSVHMLKAGDSNLPPSFDRAYKGSRAIVMELAMDKVDPMQAASWILEHGMLPEGTTLEGTLGSARYKRVSAEAERLGLPLDAVGMMQPWALGLQLMDMQYLQLGYDPNQGVEQQLTSRAQADGKPISGLETMDEQLGLLQGMPMSDQLKFLDMILDDMHEVGGETQSVVTAWRNGDSGRLAGLLGDEYKAYPALYRRLVAERNKRWIGPIESLLHGNRDTFIVVGALHLVGDGGLIDLLQRDGFKAEPVN